MPAAWTDLNREGTKPGMPRLFLWFPTPPNTWNVNWHDESSRFFGLLCHKARLVSFHCATSRTVLGLGVVLPFPAPEAFPPRRQKRRRDTKPLHRLKLRTPPTIFPIDYFGGSRYNGRWAQIKICCVGLGLKVASCIGTWGGANSSRPAFCF